MRKRFVAKRNQTNFIIKIVIAVIIIFFLILGTRYLFKLLIISDNEKKVNDYLAIASNNLIGDIRISDLLNFNLNSPDTFLKMSFSGINPLEKQIINNKPLTVNKESSDPLIYIYNTHQSEDYNPGTLSPYNITPTVYMASVMLQKALAKKNITAIVEEQNIKDILNANGWTFNNSYLASRLWLERAKEAYPTVKYFIDLHRDSVSGTVTIEDIPYAKLMFVVGMNHDNYQQNESLVLNLQEYFKTSYGSVIKNIFYGKNSRYNQDFNNNVFLIEVGGPNNTIDEVYNSINIFAEAIEAVIGGI